MGPSLPSPRERICPDGQGNLAFLDQRTDRRMNSALCHLCLRQRSMYNEGMEFSRLEKAAIETILSKPVDGMEVARAQFAAASVVKRDYTGVGFYATMSVPRSVPPMPASKELYDACFDGAGGCPKSDPEGWVLFHLWSDDGYISCLEGYTVRDSWPPEDDIEDLRPFERRRVGRSRLLEDDLIPDCENRFETWRRNTPGATLLKSVLLGLAMMGFVAMILLTLIRFFA